MSRGPLLVAALGITALIAIPPALAGADVDGFAAALKDATGDASAVAALTGLTTFKLGKKCWARLPDKDAGAVHAASFATRDIVAYAKAVTGEDWSSLDAAQLAPKVDAFRSRFLLETTVDGDDCDAGQNSLWLRYWSGLATIVKTYPPPSGKALIKLDVGAKIRDVSVDISKDGTTFSIKAPKDVEVSAWSDKLERPFRKLNSGITDDFAFATKEATGKYFSAWVLTKLHTFKLGKRCLAKLADKDNGAIHAATFATRDIYEYAKVHGAQDWDQIEGQSVNDPKYNRELVAKDMDEFKPNLSITIKVEGDDCDAGQNALWLRYWTTIATALRDYPPRAKKLAIVLNVTSRAKDVTSSGFTFTAPRDKEGPGWDEKLIAPFRKASGKK